MPSTALARTPGAVEGALHLGRIDVRSAPDDEQLLPVSHHDVSGGVDEPDVPGPQLVAVEGLDRVVAPETQHRRVCAGPRPVIDASNHDLPLRAGKELLAGLVADAYLEMGQGHATGSLDVLAVDRFESDHRGRFGETVSLVERHTEPGPERGVKVLRAGCSPGPSLPQAA